MITQGGMGMGTVAVDLKFAAEPRMLLWFPGHSGVGGDHPPLPAVFPFRLLQRGGPRVRVLMVEDDPAIAEMYRVQLEHDGYRVTVATTGELAFTSLSDEEPDVVLLDLLLPDRSGFEVLATLNERFPNHPPVVILSNYGEPSMIDRGRSLGAVEYLVKSRVTPAEISERVPMWAELGRRGGQKDS
jgi:CheY-like chemotaxis protein